MKKAAGILLLVLLVAAFALPGSADMNKYSTVFMDTFDTVISLIGYAENQETFDARAAETHAMYLHLHKLFDTYNSYADEGITSVYDVNRQAAVEPVKVDPILFGLLTFCKSHYELVNGQTNVAMGSVLSIWHEYRELGLADPEHAAVPSAEELYRAGEHTDIDRMLLDPEKRTVYLTDPEMSLDVGSVGKGYAVEMVCQAAEARGLTSALVSVGGNLRAIGVKPDGSQWTGGVENPWSSSDVYTSDSMLDGAINMSDMALVTSGDYQRYYVVDGKRYHHLIDPDTLFPAAYFNGVTVLCSDSGLADCLTTGLFCQPLEDGMKIVESLDGVEAMWCTPDQQVITSSGWDSHLKK